MKLNVEKLSAKPWWNLEPEVVQELLVPRGFIGEEERRALHYIARNCISGAGQIVDAGACIGSSAFCLASGLARSPLRGNTRVHSYDRFTSEAEYVSELVTQNFKPCTVGTDIYDVYETQIKPYKSFISAAPWRFHG